MRLIANIVRVFAGVLFVFSGFIKINDPIGFSIKLEEYLIVFASDLAPKPDTLSVNINNGASLIDESFNKILHNEPESEIKIRTQPWEHLEVKNAKGISKSFFDKTTIYVLLDGRELYKKEIEKSNAAPLKFVVNAQIKSKVIYNKSITIYNNKDIVSEDIINLETYIKEEGWSSKFCNAMIPLTLFLAIFICAFEIVLGIALLIGLKKNLTLSLLALMRVFFSSFRES